MDWLNESSNIDTYTFCGFRICWERSDEGPCIAQVCIGSKFCAWNY